MFYTAGLYTMNDVLRDILKGHNHKPRKEITLY